MGWQFGNDQAKVGAYKKFWKREAVSRPILGFTLKTWFPLDEFRASAAWPKDRPLEPDMVEPRDFLDDQERLLSEADAMDDDIFRGATPSQAVFWCCGALGARMRVMPGNVVPEDRSLSWEEIASLWDRAEEHPWWRKYMEFIDVLAERSAGRFPVSHSTVVGPLDFSVSLRGHQQTVLDLIDEPEKAAALLERGADYFIRITRAAWERIPRFLDGYYDAQYQLWAPGPIARMQEDAVAVLSPDLYRRWVNPVDRRIAEAFECSFMHLHSTSMFILDQVLEIEALRCVQINNDVAGPPLEEMIPRFRQVQAAGRSLLIRGSFGADELKRLLDSLDPQGLYLNIMVGSREEAEALKAAAGR